ncbi:MAG: Stp1/IreP family PP2C-type Ser/Thr phosphatase [Solirubrobacterales bacterium]|nr:Stp1/IreP family PP2C-type Ser/Thr phosphatase [Solirubrobacterales bacterium]
MLRAAETTERTDTGRQRSGNEDCSFARPPVFAVADGMGGAKAGEVASRIAVGALQQGLPDGKSPEERLSQRVREANREIYERSHTERELDGMGTTLTAVYLDDAHLSIAHVGDSRAYLFRDGELRRLTQDHSLVDELVRRGKLTEEQAAEHPQRSIITRALGPEPDVEVDTWTYPVRAGDVLLLCSDGLTSMVTEEAITQVLASTGELEHAADQLIGEANEAGGRDNITVVLFRLEEVGAEQPGDGTMVSGPAVRTTAAQRAQQTSTAPSTVKPKPLRPRVERERVAASAQPEPPRARRRFAKPLAALVAVLVVLFLVGGGGYLASRQLYFVGTNSSGVVTVYRGFPYDLPAGIHLYETYYVSGVPASSVPADRRKALLDHHLRSQSDATNLVKAAELGQLNR